MGKFANVNPNWRLCFVGEAYQRGKRRFNKTYLLFGISPPTFPVAVIWTKDSLALHLARKAGPFDGMQWQLAPEKPTLSSLSSPETS